jgi:hypothetical protein
MSICYTYENITAKAIAETLLNNVILAEYRVSKRILTDRGSNFNTKLS